MFGKLRQRLRVLKYRGRGVEIADDCRLMGKISFGSEPYLVSIGKHVTISGKVTFITHDGATFVFRHMPKYRKVVKFGRITIHDNCFIGHGSIILPGVTIGPNAVVGAMSVVTKDVPPDSVVVGNPARVLMSVEEYAEKMLHQTPDYDEEAYRRDKKEVLLQLYPYAFGNDGSAQQEDQSLQPVFESGADSAPRSSK